MTANADKPANRLKLAVVWWGDAQSGIAWDPIEHAGSDAKPTISSGFLHSITSKGVCLIQSYAGSHIRHDLFIPRGMITKIKVVSGRFSKP